MGSDNKFAGCEKFFDFLHSKFYSSVCETDAAAYCAFVGLVRDGIASLCSVDGTGIGLRHGSGGCDVRGNSVGVDFGVCVPETLGLDVDGRLRHGGGLGSVGGGRVGFARLSGSGGAAGVPDNSVDSRVGDSSGGHNGRGGEGELRVRRGWSTSVLGVTREVVGEQERVAAGPRERGLHWERNERWREKRKMKRRRRMAMCSAGHCEGRRGLSGPATCRSGDSEGVRQVSAGSKIRGRGVKPANRSESDGLNATGISAQLWAEFTPVQRRQIADSRASKMVNENVLASVIAKKRISKGATAYPAKV